MEIKLKSLKGLIFFTYTGIFYTFESQIDERKVNKQSFFIGWKKSFKSNASRSK